MTDKPTVEPYGALAGVYQSAGFAAYSLKIAPVMINLAFEIDWTGSTLLDLACGTGDMACWFAGRGLRVKGMDLSAPMLVQARRIAAEGGMNAEFEVGDMRTFASPVQFDMVTCVGSSINYASTLKELERVFRVAHAALAPGKLFMFDLRTILGLSKAAESVRVVSDTPTHLIVSRNHISYETLTLTTHYTILESSGNQNWTRAEEVHLLRGYPVQAVTRMLEQIGFKLVRSLTPEFELAERVPEAEQIIFAAQKL